MSHYGVFGGWFTLFGTRGRISHILVLIIAWFVFSIAFLFSLYGGLGLSIFLMDFQLFQNAILNLGVAWIVLLLSILVLTFWTSVCITTQRLRHIGFRGPFLFILTLIAIFPLPIEFYLNIDQDIFTIVYGVYAIFILIWPGKTISRHNNKLEISKERVEPKI